MDRQAQAVQLNDFDTAAKLDADFHTALVAETPNAPLKVLTEQLVAMAHSLAQGVYEVPGAAAHSITQHEEIVEALASGNIQLTARLVRDHARTASRYALDKLNNQITKSEN